MLLSPILRAYILLCVPCLTHPSPAHTHPVTRLLESAPVRPCVRPRCGTSAWWWGRPSAPRPWWGGCGGPRRPGHPPGHLCPTRRLGLPVGSVCQGRCTEGSRNMPDACSAAMSHCCILGKDGTLHFPQSGKNERWKIGKGSRCKKGGK